eukprot:364337-Chlamydomonas_euryale.AAC.8
MITSRALPRARGHTLPGPDVALPLPACRLIRHCEASRLRAYHDLADRAQARPINHPIRNMALRQASSRLLTAAACLPAGARGMSAAPAKLPDLPYDLGALEPVISGKVGAPCAGWRILQCGGGMHESAGTRPRVTWHS